MRLESGRGRAVSVVAAFVVGASLVPAVAEAAGADPTEPADAGPPAEPLPEIDVNATPRDELTAGGRLRLPIDAMPTNWNPLHADADSAVTSVLAPLQDALWRYDDTGTPTPNPDFLEGVDIGGGTGPGAAAGASEPPEPLEQTDASTPADASEPGAAPAAGAPCALPDDPFTVTYRLNPAATWNNGSPITAADFEANWLALNGVDDRFDVASTAGYDRIGAVAAGTDEFEVVVSFCRPYGDYQALFDTLLAAPAVADPATFNEGWIGRINDGWLSGPFVVAVHEPAQGPIELARHESYHGESALLDAIEFRVVPADRQPQALANGELDAFSLGADPNGFQLVSATDGIEVRAARGRAFRQLTINTAAGPLHDAEVRQAIAVSLDRAAIAAAGLDGLPGTPELVGNRLAPRGSPLAVDHAPDADPDAAGELLEEAGWELGDDGVRAREGESLEVTFTRIAGVRSSAIEADLVAEQLGAAGFTVEIVDVELADWLDAVAAGEFEIVGFQWVSPLLTYRAAPQLYGTAARGNFTFAELPEVDSLLDDLVTATDDDERAVIANEIDVILWDEAVTIPLYRIPDLVAVPTGLANWGAFGHARPVWADVGYVAG